MNPRTTATAIILTLLTHLAAAGPVADIRATYRQPDGTSFTVQISGDEWIKIRTTADGCTIARDEKGWWCYGSYDEEGRLTPTEYRIGSPAPAAVISASRNIPYRHLAERASARRSVGSTNSTALLNGIQKQAAATKSGAADVTKKGLALLVQFSDTEFTYDKEDFVKMLNEKGYKGTGSAKDYFEDQFGQGWKFEFEVSDIITLSYPAEHYGRNDADGQDIRPWDMIAEACRLADEKIDFADFDQDEDGWVDNVYVFYAGLSEAEHTEQPDLIWPHQYYIYSGTPNINLKLDDKQIDRYACSAEIMNERSLTGIGSFCHEYAHTFGLMDLYDTDYDDAGGWAAGTWRYTSLMDGGSYNNNSATPPNFNCIEREMLGLSEPVILEDGGSYTLDPIQNSGAFCRLNSDSPGEYYLLECRSNEGWDGHIGGKGMLVYHIDKDFKSTSNGRMINVWTSNMVNALLSHQCADLIEADGRSESIHSMSDLRGDISGIFFPLLNVNSLGVENAPALDFWNGNSSNLAVIGIRYEDGKIRFSVQDKSQVNKVPAVKNVQYTAFPDAAIITFSSGITADKVAKPVLKWKKNGSGDDYQEAFPVDCGDGRFSCKIEGLTGGNVSYETLIWFEINGVPGSSYRLPFQTKRKPTVDWPYIYITDSQIRQDTGLPLHVVNASKAAQIVWSYDGTEFTPDPDHYFRPDSDGMLKVTITWEDGNTDTIVKKLNVTK